VTAGENAHGSDRINMARTSHHVTANSSAVGWTHGAGPAKNWQRSRDARSKYQHRGSYSPDFGDEGINIEAPPPPLSGLIEQPAWFSRLRTKSSKNR